METGNEAIMLLPEGGMLCIASHPDAVSSLPFKTPHSATDQGTVVIPE